MDSKCISFHFWDLLGSMWECYREEQLQDIMDILQLYDATETMNFNLCKFFLLVLILMSIRLMCKDLINTF